MGTLTQEIARRGNDSYSRALQGVIDILGYDGKNYELHYPIVINKKKFKKTFENIDWETKYIVWRSIYGNINNVPSDEVGSDFKFYNKPEFNKKKRGSFISSPNLNRMPYLKKLLDDIC
jgi:hypothetical protein